MRSLVLVAVLASTASAQSMTVTGTVGDVRSRWTADGSRIVSEATVHTDAGDVVVSQLGGTVDGLTQRSWPGPEPLITGMRATVVATTSLDLSQRPHNVVDGVKVLAYPPGYVRTGPTKAGGSLYWESGCVFLRADSAGTKWVAGDAEFTAIEQSIGTWNAAAQGCSYMQLKYEGKAELETAGKDRVNVIKFRDTTWCRPASGDDAARCHPDSAAGITTATYVDDGASGRDGAIVDADIELNGVHFAIAIAGQTLSQETCISELKNTLTHELGHLLGFEHTCLAPGDPARIDHMGRSVPSCASASQEIQATTMFNFQVCGERIKETLEPDDIAAICGVYPIANDPGTCEKVDDDTGCCNSGRHPVGSLLVSMFVGMVLLTRFWRRRA